MRLDLYKERQIKRLKKVQAYFKRYTDYKKRLSFFDKNVPGNLTDKEKYYYLVLDALDQKHLLELFSRKKTKEKLVKILNPIERFFAFSQGLVGYQLSVLELLEHKEKDGAIKLHYPHTFNLQEKKAKPFYAGLKAQAQLAEVYVVGGAGDRLGFVDAKTQKPKPVALLHFLDRSLLEHLVRNLEGREYLYYKLFHKSLLRPLVLMTSDEKKNHQQIIKHLEDKKFFSRPKSSFHFLHQPRVPMIDKRGRWQFENSHLFLKPGGHGMIWQLLKEQKGFEFLKKMHARYLLLRQINNPIGGIDDSHLSFIGYGTFHKKAFGFMTTDRIVNAQEGMVVVKQNTHSTVLTNIEYTEFSKYGIKDEPKPKSNFSYFPANTNILFANIASMKRVVQKDPLCGQILNFKDKKYARLESTMQNVADDLTSKGHVKRFDRLLSFAAYDVRSKTLSVCKKKIKNNVIDDTLLGVIFDYFKAHEALFDMCGMSYVKQNKKTFLKAPNFVFEYHPALGQLFSIISQKIQRCVLKKGAELFLNIAELSMDRVHIDGSLMIEAKKPVGTHTNRETLGRCILSTVRVKNKGLKFPSKLWSKGEYERHQSAKIILEGNSAFYAEDVTLTNQKIVVKDGYFCVATMQSGKLQLIHKPLKDSAWYWKYQLEKNGMIKLKRK
ncbi:MAG: hypothetical protein K940chlam8_01127 [Chlamydiae bacterium]|nr:hypothetical protein [Chlamydiota bacterium]